MRQKITCFDASGVEEARNWLLGIRPIPDADNAVDVLGDIEGFDITDW